MSDHRLTKQELILELQRFRQQEEAILDQMHCFEVIERISRINLQSSTMEEVLVQVLDELLSIFNCDRAWLLYPCDPSAPFWSVPMERTRPEWPGAKAIGAEFPVTADALEVMNTCLESMYPICFDEKSGRSLPKSLSKQFSVRSQMSLPLYPKSGQAWLLGIHHCAKNHVFSEGEIRIFSEIGQRISDVLSSAIYFHDMTLSENKYRSLFEQMAQGVLYHDTHGRITSANPAAEHILDLSLEQIRETLSLTHPWQAIHEDGSNFSEETHPSHIALKTGQAVHNVVMGIFHPRKKTYRWIRVDAIPHFKPGQEKPDEIFTTFSDITASKQNEEKNRMAAAVFQNTAEGVFITNKEDLIVTANKAFLDMTGYVEEEIRNQPLQILRPSDHDTDFYTAMETSLKKTGLWQGELTIRRKNGDAFPAWLTTSAVRDDCGQLTHHVSLFSDITSLRRSREQLDFLAFHDPLTHLPNRLLFNDRLEHALKRAQRESLQVALYFLDLDRFKIINDSLGHPIGDMLLQQVAERICGLVRKGDTVARLGGDEFMIILDKVDGVQGSKVFAHKLMATFISPFFIKGHEFRITVSMGISLYPQDGEDPATLIKNADTAMYQAKEEGRNNYAFYTSALTTAVSERLTLGTELHSAMKKNELVLYYQPQYSLKTGRLIGAEALIRWRHPKHGLLLPAQFIPYAEESDLIVTLGEWVLKNACRQVLLWQKDAHAVKRVAVNISGVQFLRGELVKTVRNALRRSGLNPSHLELEITESFFMKNTQWAIKALKELKNLGVTIVIDDFGTGYSSLSYLELLPIDKLKIDQSFIRDIPGDLSDKAVARAVLSLAHALNYKVIAEGVETQAQQNYLKSLHCDESQGFLYSPAVTAEMFSNLAHHIETPSSLP